jgi:hypothetical protein
MVVVSGNDSRAAGPIDQFLPDRVGSRPLLIVSRIARENEQVDFGNPTPQMLQHRSQPRPRDEATQRPRRIGK